MFNSILIAGILLFPAHAKKVKKAPQPCWVTQACAPYTNAEYLIGVGSGLDIAAANTAALGSLSQQLTVTIAQQQIATKENSETVRDQRTLSSTDHQNLRTKTSISATTTLERVEFVEHWTQHRSGAEPVIYTLAVIHRTTWIDQLNSERREIQSNISNHRMAIKQKPHVLDQLIDYRALIPLIQQEQMLYSNQQLIEPSATVMPPSYTAQQVESELETARQSMSIALDSSNHLKTNVALQRSLQQYRFLVSNNPTTTLSCLGEPIVAEPDNYGFYRYSIQIQCDLQQNGQTVWSHSYTSQAASRDKNKAERQLWTVVDQDLSAVPKHLMELFSL